jgi:uncharacterized caspase-like protein
VKATVAYWLPRILAALFFIAAAMPATAAETLRGVALVVGNSAYRHLPPLANPEIDARAIEYLFDDLGFETFDARDADATKLRRAIERFVEDAEGADVAVVYYAGHGIEAGGENFLVPVDADLSALDAAGDKLVPLTPLLRDLRAAAPMTIVLLDACRDNPFPAGAMVRDTPDASPAPIAAGGLGEMRGVARFGEISKTAPETLGTLIGFAAEPGRAALDGEPGSNSPYAAAVLRHLATMAGEEFGTVMRMVAEEVYLKTSGRQRPWVNESLRRLLYFGRAPDPVPGEEGEILAERRQLLLTIAALPDAQRQQVERAAKAAGGVPMDALYGLLRVLGQDIPKDPAALDKLLGEQAGRLGKLLAERATLTSADPEIVRLSALAGTAIAEGALTTAIRLHEDAKRRVGVLEKTVQAAEVDIRARRIEFAEVFRKSAESYLLAGDRLAAAADYARGFEQVRPWDNRLAWDFKRLEMLAYGFHGGYSGDNQALERAIALAEEASDLARPLDAPTQAEALSNLGQVLSILGQRQVDTALLERALDTLRAARDRYPAGHTLEKAVVETNIGGALWTIAQRDGDMAKLVQAIATFRAALDFFDRAREPKLWGDTQANLAGALYEFGRLTANRGAIEESRRAFENALLEHRRDIAPGQWASSKSGLAAAVSELGKADRDAAELLRAAGLMREALEERTPERGVLARGETLYNLASILFDLGEVEGLATYYEEAVGLFHSALELRTRERAPREWARTKVELAVTLERLAGGDAKRLDEALSTYREALEVYTFEQAPREWAHVLTNIGNVQSSLGAAEPGTDRLAEAVECYRAVLMVKTREKSADDWAYVQYYLGASLLELTGRAGDTQAAADAITAFAAARSVLTRERDAVLFADITTLLGKAGVTVGDARRDRAMLAEASQALKLAQTIYRERGLSTNEVFLAQTIQLADSLLLTMR